jgi:arabinogalactan endo-1,4-beta-galactosidase
MKLRVSLGVLAVVTALPGSAGGQGDDDVERPILGVDLSYVNEVEGCGATFHDGTREDPFAILAAQGANLVRARLWHDPEWTDYSTLDDVIRTFERAEANGMATLLDFHYSDEWADPGRQTPPAAWSEIADTDELAEALATYTVDALERLAAAGVLPDMLQVGNETNGGLVKSAVGLDWKHDLPLFQAGIEAVRSVSEATAEPIDIVIHIAQPENALAWFEEADAAGLSGYDVIGLSYYPQWSRFTPAELGATVDALATAYDKDVLVVETAYPWTMESAGDSADNILDQALRSYDISPDGQARFMSDVTAAVVANGGLGTVYWEPAWLSTTCRTRWGQGSHWENATLFDFDGALHEGADYLADDYPSLSLTDVAPVSATDPAGDVDDPNADLTELSVASDGQTTAITAMVAGDVRHWPGALILAIDMVPGEGGDGGRRPIEFAATERPEQLIVTSWSDEPGVGYVAAEASAWGVDGWESGTFTGRAVIEGGSGTPSRVTWTLPADQVGTGAGITVISTRRGRAGAIADAIDPDTPDEPVTMTLRVRDT